MSESFWAGNGETSPHYPATPFRDIKPRLDAGDFIQGLLLENSAAVLYGQPSSGKTFFGTTIALHVAAGLEFSGRRVEGGGVIYVAMEGGIGFANRVHAWRQHHGYEDCDFPFYAIHNHLNLRDPDNGLEHFIAACHALAERMSPMALKLIVIDTLARALSGGNENSPDDMGKVIMAIDRIRRETGAAVLLIHHSGKDHDRGARGHSSLLAAIDTEIEVEEAEDGSRTATVSKQRDLAKGVTIAFSLDTIELGENKYSEPVTTCLVRFTPLPPSVKAKLKGDQKRAYDLLCDLVAASGRSGFDGTPDSVLSIPEEWWRNAFYDKAKPGANQDTKQRAYRRAADALVESRRVGLNKERVWITSKYQPDIQTRHDPDKAQTPRQPDLEDRPDNPDTPL